MHQPARAVQHRRAAFLESHLPPTYTVPFMLRFLFAISCFSLLLSGQPIASEIAAWEPPPGEARTPPAVACTSLRALTGFEFSIITATLIPASGDSAEFCRVQGLIQPEIRFEVSLPTSWHGRLLVSGNGGYAGDDLTSPGRQRTRDIVITAGFVHAHTNTGHDAAGEDLGAFAMNSQKLVDYAFRAIHVTTLSAKRLASAYYGVAPRRSYFIGCSTGGRQALMSAQRFPEDFDGIYAGAPVLDFVLSMTNYVYRLQSMPETPISSAKLRRAGEVIYERCDALDGVRDGLLEDPRTCDFEPAKHLTKCAPNASSDCFTEGEIAFLQRLYSDQFISGQRIFPGWPVGIEVPGRDGRIGWDYWLVRENAAPRSEVFAEAFFRYLALPRKDPNLRYNQIDLAAVFPQLGPIRETLNATDPDLSAFRDRGGKLLMWFGWADESLNPNMGVEYYESVVATMGANTPDFFRLFMMPGVFHCGRGPGCDTAPRLAALIRWVERGEAPEKIVASRGLSETMTRTRPLCPYPQIARYKGSGSTDDEANFVCAAPDPK